MRKNDGSESAPTPKRKDLADLLLRALGRGGLRAHPGPVRLHLLSVSMQASGQRLNITAPITTKMWMGNLTRSKLVSKAKNNRTLKQKVEP